MGNRIYLEWPSHCHNTVEYNAIYNVVFYQVRMYPLKMLSVSSQIFLVCTYVWGRRRPNAFSADSRPT